MQLMQSIPFKNNGSYSCVLLQGLIKYYCSTWWKWGVSVKNTIYMTICAASDAAEWRLL